MPVAVLSGYESRIGAAKPSCSKSGSHMKTQGDSTSLDLNLLTLSRQHCCLAGSYLEGGYGCASGSSLSCRDRAVEEARALAAAEAEVALAAAEAQHAAQLSELQADLSRLRSSTQRSSYLAEDPEVCNKCLVFSIQKMQNSDRPQCRMSCVGQQAA